MENTNRIPPINFEGARLIWRNFSGKQTKFNPAGNRNFHVVLDEETANRLKMDGWNVKMRAPREEGDDPLYTIQIAVKYEFKPPKIYMISGHTKTELDEDSVNALDYAEIENVDLTVNASQWELNGKTGVKAYLKSMYVTIVRDEFADKYKEYDE